MAQIGYWAAGAGLLAVWLGGGERQELHREAFRALVGCAVAATPTLADAGAPESCATECFEGWR